ncbi:type IV pilus modification PilV family protein [Thalassotalea ganghwensis]
MRCRSPYHVSGFTLLETIVGIVMLSISFAILTNLLYPAIEQSGDQVHQIRAAELGQSLLNEISAYAFDENSDRAGGRYRCNEDADDSGVVESSEQCSNVMGRESGEGDGTDRTILDDVDDFNGIGISNAGSSGFFKNSQNDDLSLYLGYSVEIEVCNDSDYDGDCATNANNYTAKLIRVTVITPTGFAIDFSTYRANF